MVLETTAIFFHYTFSRLIGGMAPCWFTCLTSCNKHMPQIDFYAVKVERNKGKERPADANFAAGVADGSTQREDE